MSTVGDMLRLARQLRGFTQIVASSKLGILQNVLSRFENGVATPDDTFLVKAAIFYKVPRGFFDLREPVYGPPVSVHPMTRGKADVTARDLDMITAELNVRLFHLNFFLEGVDVSATADLPSLDVEQYGSPSHIAATVRAHWGVPGGAVKNLTQLVERAGVIVGHSRFGGASVSGVTFRAPGKNPLVLINSLHPADRARFTLAHELGHLIMHRFPTANMEAEANEFASSFLMPEAEIKSAFRGRKVTLETLAALKPEWKVAMQALLMRASSLQLLSSNQSKYLWQQISAKGWRLREPADVDFAHEVPTVLASIVRSHIEHLGYSADDLANIVRIYRSEFSEMYGEFDQRKDGPRLRLVN